MPGMGVPSTVTQGKKAKMILAGVRKEFLTIGSATQNAAGPEARPRSSYLRLQVFSTFRWLLLLESLGS